MQRKRPLRPDPGIENLLWLRLKLLGFRRNAHFRTFLLPFVDHAALLVVELGSFNEDGGRRTIVRDRLLREAGYTVLRFPRADAMQNLTSVIATIRAVLQDRVL